MNLVLMGKVTHGMELNSDEINEIANMIKSKPETHRELWVRIAVMVGMPGIIEYATDEEIKKMVWLKNI